MGKKYVIELEDKPLCVYDKDTCTYFPRVHRVKGFNTLVFDEVGLSKLTPIEDAENMAYTRGHEEGLAKGRDEAWEAARKIVTWPNRRLINSDTFDLDPGENIFTKYLASEAIAKIKAYEEQEADKIKVGDEVVVNGLRGVVMKLDEKGNIDRYFTSDGKTFGNITGFLNNEVTKTGRYFPQVAELLEAMKGGEE